MGRGNESKTGSGGQDSSACILDQEAACILDQEAAAALHSEITHIYPCWDIPARRVDIRLSIDVLYKGKDRGIDAPLPRLVACL